MNVSFFQALGLLGVWRWSIWALKKLVSVRHHPISGTGDSHLSTSVVIPVFNERVDVLKTCIESIAAQHSGEIIVVIQKPDNYTYGECLQYVTSTPGLTVISTTQRGKRPAMLEGFAESTGDIIIFVDSDVRWSSQFLEKALPAFSSPTVGAVCVATRADTPTTLLEHFQDACWQIRNNVNDACLAQITDAVSCITGRTALYRRDIIQRCQDTFLQETFLGNHLYSGDDKFLTRETIRQGYDIAFQSESTAFTVPATSARFFLKQTLRWTRNSVRSDLKALCDLTIWKHKPVFNLYHLDKFAGRLTLVFGTVMVFVEAFTRNRLPHVAGAMLGMSVMWWLLSRSLKLRLSSSVRYLRVSLMYAFGAPLFALLSLYSLLTVWNTKWLTR